MTIASATARDSGAEVTNGSTTALISVDADGNPTATIIVLAKAATAKNIWEFTDALEKRYDDDGKPIWKCLFCKNTFKTWNATKAIFHLAKKPGECA